VHRQLTTLRVSNAPDARERLRAIERFGRALAGNLYDVYGSVAGERKKRPLRVNPPTVYSRSLIRYQGGSHGPVLLAAVAGISSRIFSLDSVDPNLVEFLFAHSYDVWLLDSTNSQDREAALSKIKEVTGAAGVRTLPAGWDTPAPVDLNFATREAAPAQWHAIPIISSTAARDVYPRILEQLSSLT